MQLKERKYKHYTEDEKSIRMDEVFKIVFGNNYRSQYLKRFLEALLDIHITNIVVRNEVALDKNHIDSKLMKLDILAEIDNNIKINIEMQSSLGYNIVNRGEAYASSIFSSNLNVGEDYLEVPKTIVIWLLDHDLFQDGPYHEQSKLIRKSNNEVLAEDITYHFIQLPKFIKQTREIKTEKEQWLAYISHQLNDEELEELFEMNDDIKEIDEIVDKVVNSEELRMAIMDKMLAKYERNLEKAGAHAEGKAEGKAEGLVEGKIEGRQERDIEVARNLKNLSVPIETIMEATGLTREEIEKL
ncbi:MAG: Rpn family recombination-promoting nuclease/putative transposase [Clostridia bacterium]|nr:Rpn family recombination-promoting nuclease/putative transposase [Clostridia bacterium]